MHVKTQLHYNKGDCVLLEILYNVGEMFSRWKVVKKTHTYIRTYTLEADGYRRYLGYWYFK